MKKMLIALALSTLPTTHISMPKTILTRPKFYSGSLKHPSGVAVARRAKKCRKAKK